MENFDLYESNIRGVPLFRGISDEQLSPLLEQLKANIKTFQEGDYISLEDDSIAHIGIILKGRVDMIKEDVWGHRTVFVRMRPYELFGESFACGLEQKSTVTFVSEETSVVLFVGYQNILKLGRKSQILENLTHLLSEKNVRLMEKIEVISKPTLREKISTFLWIQSRRQKSKYVEIHMKRSEWADYLCANRSSLARELVLMKEEGLIDFDRNIFFIKDLMK